MSWDLTSEAAKDVLRIMAYLAPVGVPRSLLRQILALPDVGGLDDPMSESLSELTRLSLVELDIDGNPLMHRLLQAFARYSNQIDKTSHLARTVTVILEEMRATFNNPGAAELRLLETLAPHAEALAAGDDLSPDNSVNLLRYLASHHRDMGRYKLAEDFARAAIYKAERGFEAGHASIASSQSTLATVLQDLGRLEDARDLLRKALASDERSFEAGHPSIAIRQSNLALVLRDLGQLEEARDLLGKALASDERSFEAGHPSIAGRQSNLALVLKDLGQLEEARDLLRNALASAERSFEAGHPSIARSQSNLALVLKDLGQLEEARDLLRKALASFEAKFEPAHPSIVTVRGNLESVLLTLEQRASSAEGT